MGIFEEVPADSWGGETDRLDTEIEGDIRRRFCAISTTGVRIKGGKGISSSSTVSDSSDSSRSSAMGCSGSIGITGIGLAAFLSARFDAGLTVGLVDSIGTGLATLVKADREDEAVG